MPAAARAAGLGGGAYGFSPLGTLKYGPGFSQFDYVAADAPRGGTLRLIRNGAFGTLDTLNYPAQPADDVRLVYDRLVVASEDEVASYYGLLAETIDVAPDYGEIVFTLREEARWHDGTPLSAEDVAFTFATLKEKGAPFYRQAFRPLEVSADGGRVIVRNSRRGDRDVVRRLSALPVHPRHLWQDGAPERPVGSGPLRVVEAAPPRRLVLERVDDYWGKDLAVNRGRWNFDRIEINFLRDDDVALEAFKADETDVRNETSPVRWRTGYAGQQLESGRIRQSETHTLSVGTLHGLTYNLRRPLLAERRLRLALALASDTAEMNRLLFAGAYAPFASVFPGTDLEANGAAGKSERALLDDLLPAAALENPSPLADLAATSGRAALAAASALLDEAGYPLDNGLRLGPDGQPITLATVSVNPAYERPLMFLERAWKRLGIGLSIVRTDPASAARRMLDKDFDLATLSWSPARLPGTAERLLWHSALADAPGSYALSGLRSPAVDHSIEALERASDADDLAIAGRAFDRAFRHSLALLPLYRENTIRTAWWDRFGRPPAEEAGFPPSPIDRWWALG
ncbi:MAG: extracellular solute-binding protein [Acuticoccus sp.]